MPSSEPLDPSSLEHASFRIVRRGFETSSVRGVLDRAAAEIAELRRLNAELQARHDELMAGSGLDLLEAHRVASALGTEASQVLEAAQVAAAERAERAEREAQAVHEEAVAAAGLLRETAAEDAEGMREQGEARRSEIIAEAETEAARIVEEARLAGRDMVREAQTVRERMLRDLGRKRHTGRAQVEQLRAVRDRLLESLGVVQASLDDALADLAASVPEARRAAERAGLRISEQRESSAGELEAEIEAARIAGLGLTDPLDPVDTAGDDPGPDVPAFVTSEMASLSDVDAALAPADAEAESAEAEPAEPGGPEPSAAAGAESGAPAPAGPVEPEPSAAAEAEPAEPAPAEREPDAVDDVFAKLRQATAQSEATAAREAGEPEADDPAAPEQPDAEPAEPDADAAEEPAAPDEPEQDQARNEAVESASRALKKVLVDEQSTLLHRIRSQGDDAVAELLADPDRAGAYRQALLPLLRDLTARQGAPDSLDLAPAAERFDELALGPVEQRLGELIDSGADPDELAAAVRSLYRESRTRRIPEAVEAAVAAAADLAVQAMAEGDGPLES